MHYSFDDRKILSSALQPTKHLLKIVSAPKETIEFISINFYETALLPTGKNSKIAYEKSVERIELFTKWFFIVNLYTIVSCTFDALPYTIIRYYYYYDMGDESFYLFCPGWFVFTRK